MTTTFTFVCLSDKQVATAVDIQALEEQAYRRHALLLMHEHASAVAVEVWRDDAVIDTIERVAIGQDPPLRPRARRNFP